MSKLKVKSSNKNKDQDLSLKKESNNSSNTILIKQYTPASFKRRLFARSIDYLILSFVTLFLILIGIIIFTSTQSRSVNQYAVDICTQFSPQEITKDEVCKEYFESNLRYFNIAVISGYAINVAYFVLLPLIFGTTIGKKLLKLKVVNKDSLSKINLLQAITREIFWIFATVVILLNIVLDLPFLRTLDQITFVLISVSVIQIPFNKFRQAWHDKLASTLVVKDIAIKKAK